MNRIFTRWISVLLAVALLLPTGWLAPTAKAADAETPDIPVILYHRIMQNPSDSWTHTSTDKFRSTMKYLDENDYTTLTAEQYINIVSGTANPADIPEKPILLSFDDGTPDFITDALPILDEYEMNAVLFIVTGWIDGGFSMSREQLEDLAQNHPNVSIQNHTVYHEDNTWNKVTENVASQEISEANEFIKEVTGEAPTMLAYPYGHFNDAVKTAAEASGIKFAFKVGYPNEGNYAMGRHYVMMDTTLTQIAGWLGGPPPSIEEGNPPTSVIVYEEDFEKGQGEWTGNGATQVTVTDQFAHTGQHSLLVAGRTENYHGPSLGLTNTLKKGATYEISGYVKLAPDATQDAKIKITMEQIGKNITENSDKWKQITNQEIVTKDDWVLLTGTYTYNSEAESIKLYFESDSPTISFALDDFAIYGDKEDDDDEIREPAKSFTTITFEDQTTGGFVRRGDTEVLTVTDGANHTEDGSYALEITNRTIDWQGPSLRVEEYVDLGYEYNISMWVKLISPASTEVSLSTQVGSSESGASYINLAKKNISIDDGWVQLEGKYRYMSSGNEYLTIYLESTSADASFYIDDISFEKTDSPPIIIGKNIVPIKDTYKGYFPIGNIVSSQDLEGIRLKQLKTHHSIVTAENAMKPDQAYNADREFDFTAENDLVDKVLAEDLQMFGHVLVWHAQTPEWLHTANDKPLSSEEALLNLRTHIETVMNNFGDKVIGWDVLNEAFNDNPSNPEDWKSALRRSGWYNAIGPDYVEQAFLIAREVLDANPEWDVKLYYNDYNDDNQNKAQAIYSMVKELNENYEKENPGKLLIDGIGMQGHYNLNTNPENVEASLKKFISLGIEVSVSELDIMAGDKHVITEEQAKKQGYLYARLFEIYKKYADNIARVTFWGLEDGSSWRAENSPLPFDSSLKPKPAYYAINDPTKFLEDYVPVEKEVKETSAHYGTPVIDGTIDKIWDKAQEIPINRYQTAWQGATGVGKALWDNKNLYVLIQVNDAQLDKSSAAEHEQDSIEVFLDQNNAKTPGYQDDDGQYRVNYDNETSFNPAKIAEGFESAVHVDGTNYTVEVKIPLNAITPSNNKKLGFDLQINDAKNGSRQSVATWNDTTGTGYMDTSVYGVLTLTGKPGSTTDSGSNPDPTTPADGDSNIITPEVTNTNNQIVGKVTSDQLKKALATNKDNDKKQVTIDLSKQSSASSYEVQLPAESLDNDEDYIISINTAHGTINLSSQALSGTSVSEGQISIMITPSSAEQLDETLRGRVGNHPVLNVNLEANGEVIAWNNTAAPAVISIPYTPTADELRNPDSIVVLHIDQDGNVTTIPNGRYDAASKSVVFQTSQLGNFAVAYAENTFDDLENVQWAKQAIDAMAARDIIRGTSASSYSPQVSIQRADFIALLVRALELQGTGNSTAMFSDVQEDDYFYNELAIARELGIANGFEDNTFRPESSLSRQDMMVLAARALAAAGKQTGAGSLDAFSDADSVAGYARDEVARLVQAGIVNGKNGKLAPQDELTRAEAAVILYRIWGM